MDFSIRKITKEDIDNSKELAELIFEYAKQVGEKLDYEYFKQSLYRNLNDNNHLMIGAFDKGIAVGLFTGFITYSEYSNEILKAYELLLFSNPTLPIISSFMVIESLYNIFMNWCLEKKVKIVKIGAMAHNSFYKYLELHGFIKEEIFYRKVI